MNLNYSNTTLTFTNSEIISVGLNKADFAAWSLFVSRRPFRMVKEEAEFRPSQISQSRLAIGPLIERYQLRICLSGQATRMEWTLQIPFSRSPISTKRKRRRSWVRILLEGRKRRNRVIVCLGLVAETFSILSTTVASSLLHQMFHTKLSRPATGPSKHVGGEGTRLWS